MPASTCDYCDQPAVIHETQSRASVVKIRHLCRKHGLGMWRSAVDPAIELAMRAGKKPSLKTVPATTPVEFKRHKSGH
ncbi:MAG: hypothetical protein KDA86_22165 [Planctomycetaceae bacterium]|nr:hypothetical protein [Planctomycetaceae bacterium]